VTVKEHAFSYRPRKDGSVAIFWRNRPATVLTGMLAQRFLAAAPEASEEERQLLMARATGNFRRGNERRGRRR
jgi:hypothetical protein